MARRRNGIPDLPQPPEREAPNPATDGPLTPSKADLPPPAPPKPTGRPPEYDQEFFDDLNEKLIQWTSKRYVTFKRTGVGDIWLGDFAFENYIPRKTLYTMADPDGRYARYNGVFARTYQWARTAQESWAIFDEKLNQNIRKLLLSHFHDIKEKTEVVVPQGQGGLPAVFVNQFNYYLQQMGVAPVALEKVEIVETESQKEISDYGRDFQNFKAG